MRPLAWSHAQRRHGARIWHRDKAADAEQTATHEALSKLPVNQRRMLLLAHLTTGSMDELAREVGLPLVDAERELQSATSAFSTHRELDSTAIRGALEALADPLTDTRWPRATIIRRAGTTRRRTATLLGVAGAVGALVASGMAVNAADGVRPQLTHRVIAPSTAPTTAPPPVPPPADLSPEHLLAAEQLTRVAPALTWTVADTSENTQGKGLVLPCQTARFANPDSSGFLVRTFRAEPAAGAKRGAVPSASAMQATELSGNQRSAKATFGTTSGWFAGCTDGQTHLSRTERVSGVGDEATLFVLSSWARPASLAGRRRRPHRASHHDDGRPHLRPHPGPADRSHPARGRRQRPVRGARHGPLRRPGDRERDPAAADRDGARHDQRRRPPSRDAARRGVGRHRAAQGRHQRRGHPVRQRGVRLTPDGRRPDPDLPVPPGRPARHLRPHRDRRHPAREAGRGLRGRHPPAPGDVRGQEPRHQGQPPGGGDHARRRPVGVAAHRGDLRPADGHLPDGHHPHRHGRRADRLRARGGRHHHPGRLHRPGRARPRRAWSTCRRPRSRGRRPSAQLVIRGCRGPRGGAARSRTGSCRRGRRRPRGPPSWPGRCPRSRTRWRRRGPWSCPRER